MFVSAGALPQDDVLDGDLMIVGSGPAGLSVAHGLMGRGLRIVVLEGGGADHSRDVQMLNRGEIAGAPNHPLTHSRYRVYGGSATRWGGQCVPLEPIDFEERAAIPHSGWPFGKAHLDPWYARAAGFLGLDPLGFEAPPWERRAGALPPIAGDAIHASAIGFARPLDLGARLKADLAAAPDVTIVLGANVTAIETDDTMARATGLRFATLDGRAGRCTARRIVLAAGGIENPRLLLASTDHSPSGIGNERDLVGRFFMDHPYLMPAWLDPSAPAHARGWHVIETFGDAAENPGAHAVFTLSEENRRREGLAGCVGYFMRREAWQLRRAYVAPGGAALVHLAEIARGERVRDRDAMPRAADLLAPSALATLAGWTASAFVRQPRAALRICLETTPRPDSRVTLGQRRDRLGQRLPKLDWRINARDWDGLSRFRTAFADAVSRSGTGTLVDDAGTDGQGYPLTMTGGRHHIGTTRMHAEPAKGVVDADLKVHGLANLYVAGSSVFPTGGWANPTLTIVALSLRLGDHLSKQV